MIDRPSGPPVLYEESRGFLPPLAWPLMAFWIVGGVAVVGWGIWSGLVTAENPAILLTNIPGGLTLAAVGIAGIAAREHIEVTDHTFRYWNSSRISRRIPLTAIERAEAETRLFWAWQPEWPFTGLRVYSLYGLRRVRLTLRDGTSLVVGSDAPDECVHAILAAAPHVRSA